MARKLTGTGLYDTARPPKPPKPKTPKPKVPKIIKGNKYGSARGK